MIDLKFHFVPFSQSRNAKATDPSINWKVTLAEGFTVDYMQGCGHTPAYKNPSTFPASKKVDQHTTQRRIREECETGKITNRHSGWTTRLSIDPPATKDVMQCLLSEADVLNYSSFKDWADEFGYDSDSISAKQTYDACLKTALQLNARFNIEALRKEYAE